MKIGDTVVVTFKNPKDVSNVEIGDIGTVIAINSSPCVEFDRYVDGHDGDSRGKDGHCWWIFSHELKVKKIVPNNVLSRVMYPELVPTECGQYLEVK